MKPISKEVKWQAFTDLGACPVKIKCKPAASGPGVVPGMFYAVCTNGKVKLIKHDSVTDIFDTRGVPTDMIAVKSENSKSVLVADSAHNNLVCPGEKGDVVCLLQDSITPGALLEVDDTVVYTNGNALNRFALNDGVVQKLGKVKNVIDIMLVGGNVICASGDNKLWVVRDRIAEYACIHGSLGLLSACSCTVTTEIGQEEIILACCAGSVDGVGEAFVAVVESGYVISRIVLPAKDPTCCCVFENKLLIGFKGYTDIWSASISEVF